MRLTTLSDALKLQQRFADRVRSDPDAAAPGDPETDALTAKRQQDLLERLTERLKGTVESRRESLRRLDEEIARQKESIASLRRAIDSGARKGRDADAKPAAETEPNSPPAAEGKVEVVRRPRRRKSK